MLVQTLSKVPDDLFYAALAEVNGIDWSKVVDRSSRKGVSTYFNTSTSITLRRLDYNIDNPPQTLRDWCAIIDCIPHEGSEKYVQTNKLANFVHELVGGKRMGRIMITRLEANGTVEPHKDPYEYFETYARFHVPLITNANVVFNGGDNTVDEHMPLQSICRLNNRMLHRVENRSSTHRIHLIIDIELDGGNNIF
jgi:Aspartyl/Asparaginyl beta-hydroxylase